MTEPVKRATLSLKSPRKRKPGLSIHRPQVAPQPAKKAKKQKKKIQQPVKKIPKPIPPPMAPIPSGSKNPVWPYLNTSPTFYKHQVMAIGFLEQALVNLPEDLSMRQLKKCLKLRARSQDYLEQIIRGGARYNFDGSLADPINASGIEKAEHRLHQLKKRQEAAEIQEKLEEHDKANEQKVTQES